MSQPKRRSFDINAQRPSNHSQRREGRRGSLDDKPEPQKPGAASLGAAHPGPHRQNEYHHKDVDGESSYFEEIETVPDPDDPAILRHRRHRHHHKRHIHGIEEEGNDKPGVGFMNKESHLPTDFMPKPSSTKPRSHMPMAFLPQEASKVLSSVPTSFISRDTSQPVYIPTAYGSQANSSFIPPGGTLLLQNSSQPTTSFMGSSSKAPTGSSYSPLTNTTVPSAFFQMTQVTAPSEMTPSQIKSEVTAASPAPTMSRPLPSRLPTDILLLENASLTTNDIQTMKKVVNDLEIAHKAKRLSRGLEEKELTPDERKQQSEEKRKARLSQQYEKVKLGNQVSDVVTSKFSDMVKEGAKSFKPPSQNESSRMWNLEDIKSVGGPSTYYRNKRNSKKDEDKVSRITKARASSAVRKPAVSVALPSPKPRRESMDEKRRKSLEPPPKVRPSKTNVDEGERRRRRSSSAKETKPMLNRYIQDVTKERRKSTQDDANQKRRSMDKGGGNKGTSAYPAVITRDNKDPKPIPKSILGKTNNPKDKDSTDNKDNKDHKPSTKKDNLHVTKTDINMNVKNSTETKIHSSKNSSPNSRSRPPNAVARPPVPPTTPRLPSFVFDRPPIPKVEELRDKDKNRKTIHANNARDMSKDKDDKKDGNNGGKGVSFQTYMALVGGKDESKSGSKSSVSGSGSKSGTGSSSGSTSGSKSGSGSSSSGTRSGNGKSGDYSSSGSYSGTGTSYSSGYSGDYSSSGSQPIVSVTEKGAIKFQLPGKIEHKTTFKLTHFPDGKCPNENIIINVPPDITVNEDPKANNNNCANGDENDPMKIMSAACPTGGGGYYDPAAAAAMYSQQMYYPYPPGYGQPPCYPYQGYPGYY